MSIRGNLPKGVLFQAEFVQQRMIKRGMPAEFRGGCTRFPESTFSAGNNSREQKGKFWRLLGETLKAYSGSSRRPIDEWFVSMCSCR